ncbi:hypothetical protein LINPERPRIM_LOCUS20607 [Linum perenne]
MGQNVCSCGYFALSGIPCTHVVAAIGFLRLRVEYHINDIYKTTRVAQAYGNGIPALVGIQAWPLAVGFDVLPPRGRRMPGRPRKARRKEPIKLEGRPRSSEPGAQLSR